ncbi:MAG TPA: 3-keto-5-aminohexanoate cleavage protein [Streptosporangiaceae bacterium]|nr:3-keto-5-aminohexanoate cleavage protein [Streptosporangiaceae bacterium]
MNKFCVARRAATMAVSQKVIITCAITGSGHTPSMSPHLPYTVEQVVEQGIAAAAAGAAVLHLHARDPSDGKPTADPAVFAKYARGISDRCDVVISISTGGGTGMTVQERLAGVLQLRPELCTLNLGTMNYGSFPMIDRYRGTFRYDWEEPYLESTRAEPFVSTYADIEHMLKVVGPETGTRFEAEAYDVSHLYTLAYYLDKGLVEPPIFIQTIFGTMGGIGPDVDHIVHMKRTADRLLGDAYQWSTLGAGRYQMGIVTAAAIMGSHVRVGLEDSLYLGRGQLAESNADQVARIRRILEELSLEIATPAEARQLLRLKGLDSVGY